MLRNTEYLILHLICRPVFIKSEEADFSVNLFKSAEKLFLFGEQFVFIKFRRRENSQHPV